ncbi:hypothetical protein ACGCUP_01070 [Eubacteriales bacterium KG125]
MTKQEIKRDLEKFNKGGGTINLSEIRKYRRKSKDWVKELVKDLKPCEAYKGRGSSKEYFVEDVAKILYERHNCGV